VKVTDWYRIFAWLTIAVDIVLVVLLVLAVLRVTTKGRARWTKVRGFLGRWGLAWVALVAAVAMAGSLYLSEGAHLVPCRLCWYQRTMMYPLAIILVIAAFRRDWKIRAYAVPLAVIGAAVSIYHVLIEWHPSLESSSSCDPLNPCSALPLPRYAGFISIPTMAGSAFLFIAVVLLLARRPAPAQT
jgi:disulfide bond formation protein DsbB